MSQSRAIGWTIAIFCSVATSYYTFAPELRRVQDEKQHPFSAIHQPGKTAPQQSQSGLPEKSGGATPDHSAVASSFNPTSEPLKREPVKEEVKKAWPGLGLFKWSFGGGGAGGNEGGGNDAGSKG